MRYLKYEKTLYELTEEQAKKIITQIERGGRVSIGGELLFANKCELIADLPHNREEYEIRPMLRTQLPVGDQHVFRRRTPEEQERVSKELKNARELLSVNLGWPKK